MECFTRFFANIAKILVLVLIYMDTFVALLERYNDCDKYYKFVLSLYLLKT